ncbi:MAG: FAD-dependent monooxygenase, partial [Planctomycetota bacterium]
MAESCDCLIVGAGPAGASLAILLARDGLRVVLVDHGRGHRSGPYETLLGGARTMLDRVDLASVIGGGAEPDPLRHGAIWGEGAVAWRAGEPAGLLLRRGPFDAALRTAAAAAGVTVRCPARAMPGTHGFAVVAVGDEHAAPELWAPRLVVLATGRAGHAGVPGQRRTLALTFVGEAHAADRGSAVVEAVPCGWIWTHVPPAGPASAAVFVDEADVRTSRRGQRQFALAA